MSEGRRRFHRVVNLVAANLYCHWRKFKGLGLVYMSHLLNTSKNLDHKVNSHSMVPYLVATESQSNQLAIG